MEVKPLIVKGDIRKGASFSHDGPIVFEEFVPDHVRAVATGGGITLEKGGGNDLVLEASAPPPQPDIQCDLDLSKGVIRIGGEAYDAGALAGLLAEKIGPDRLAFTFRHVVDEGVPGVVARGPLGNHAKIKSDRAVRIEDAGDRLIIIAKGAVSAGRIGDNAVIQTQGDLAVREAGAGGLFNIVDGRSLVEKAGADTKFRVVDTKAAPPGP